MNGPSAVEDELPTQRNCRVGSLTKTNAEREEPQCAQRVILLRWFVFVSANLHYLSTIY